MVWMTAAEALEVLNVRPQTLYANVSRGKIRAKPDEHDPRRSLYHRDDVLRMARRANGRRKVEIVSSEAMQYGDPVLPSSISTAADGRLLYRGHDATTLADTASLEDIAALLWQCEPAEAVALWPAASLHMSTSRSASLSPQPSAPAPGQASAGPATQPTADGAATNNALAAALLALARRSAADPPSLGRPAAELRAEAASVLQTLTEAMAGDASANRTLADASSGRDRRGTGNGDDQGYRAGGSLDARRAHIAATATISRRLALAWQAEPHEDLIRRALVLMADHELNASTFATRVAISTGASLAAGVLAGLTTLTGPLHGGAAAAFNQLVANATQHGADHAVHDWLTQQRPLAAFGHPLYREGDPRALALLKHLPEIQPHEAIARAVEQQAGELPSSDYALAVLTAACRLPPDAPFILFATGRCVGWLAHALEQVQANRLIRPRARYTGPAAISAGIY